MTTIALAATLAAAAVWACWPAVRTMAEKWSTDPKYSHAYLVPLIALLILWSRRTMVEGWVPRPSALGLAWLGAAAALHLTGAFLFVPWFGGMSLLLYAAGAAVLVGGGRALRWAWPSVLFLGFMVPLPYRLEVAMGYPLQRAATLGGTYALQTMGLPAVADGTVLRIGELTMGVVEACSGLSMMMSFFAISTAVAVLVERPLAHRIVVLLSAVPIAILSNVIRITATAWLYQYFGPQTPLPAPLGRTFPTVEALVHDTAGWMMMPVALGLLMVELALLSRLLMADEPERRAERAPTAPGAAPAPLPMLVGLVVDPRGRTSARATRTDS